MINVIIASDKYMFLLPCFCELFNKHIGEERVVILCYAKPKKELPSNFEIFSLGNQSDFGHYWTNGLIPYFSNFHDPYVKIWLEDLFIYGVDREIYDSCESLIKRDDSIKRIIYHYDKNLSSEVRYEKDSNFVYLSQKTSYRTTLHSGIWDVAYFKKFLKPNRTAWDFELKGTKEAKNDGANLLFSQPDAVRYKGVMRNGKLAPDIINFLYAKEKDVFVRNGIKKVEDDFDKKKHKKDKRTLMRDRIKEIKKERVRRGI
jgi:hypothetical protein